MSPEELEVWVLDHPALLAYLGLLLAGSLISFIILVIRIGHSRKLSRHPVAPWPLAGTDFALFIVSIILWFVLSGIFVLQAHKWIAGEEAVPGAGISVIGGFVLQAGMLYLFLRFRFHYRSPNEGPLSPRILSMGQSLALGFFYFLACLPVVYGVGIAWNSVLEMLRERGIEIDLPLQDAVLLFQETENPFTFFGLILLAVVVAPVIEECVFRGGVYRFLKGRISISLSLLISGTLFGMIHGNLQSLPGLVAVGICLGLAYELSGSLRVPIFFHAFFNLNSIVWILILPESFAG
jgi:membrane protease YdiL (CAAX protease family)